MREHKKLPPRHGEDFVAHWCYTSFKDKVILDLGADYGSTASFFLERGAKKVIAVEGREDFHKLQENYGDDPDVVCMPLFIGKPEDIKDLINQYTPDLVKSDIEMGENVMLDIDDETLKKVPEYLIETHRYEDLFKFWKKFIELGYNFKICWLQTSTCPTDSEALVIYVERLNPNRKNLICSSFGVLHSMDMQIIGGYVLDRSKPRRDIF